MPMLPMLTPPLLLSILLLLPLLQQPSIPLQQLPLPSNTLNENNSILEDMKMTGNGALNPAPTDPLAMTPTNPLTTTLFDPLAMHDGRRKQKGGQLSKSPTSIGWRHHINIPVSLARIYISKTLHGKSSHMLLVQPQNIHERLSQDPDCTIEILGVPPNPICNDSLPMQSEAVLPDFSVNEMHRHIVRFIIADDQPINIVECLEFH
ncbi:hypothetical protein EV424DRAFT_1350762 [Suillus variegatus]|nr:hypothetical protein EV424DRAFT_1350762 [Suillus variegatus]